MFFFEIPIDVSVENLYQIEKDEVNNRNAPLETTMNHPFISSEKPLFMNQKTPSQSRQGALSKSWCRFTKAGVFAAVLAVAAAPVASARVDTYGTLSIAPLGILNIQNNNVIVRSGIAGVPTGGVFPAGGMYSGIQGYVQTGLYNGPGAYWDGPGIQSSTAATDPAQGRAVGVLDNALAGYLTWPPLDPKPLTGTEILVKYTYWGDADLDGAISGADYSLIDASVGLGLNQWLNGDFDYDGVAATGADYALIDSGLNAFLGVGGGPLVSQGASAVPEPGSVGLLAVGILTLVRRNRQGKK